MQLKFILSVAFLLLATACSKGLHYNNLSQATNVGENYPIVVKEKEQLLDIAITTGAPSEKQWQAISSFVGDYAVSRENERANILSVMVPMHVANSASASELAKTIMARLRAEKIISSSDVRVLEYDAKNYKGEPPLRLSYHKIFTQVKECGRWGDLSNTYGNINSSNFGCASQHNLAKMIANPRDLLAPRQSTAIDAARRARVIDDYRNVLETNTPDDSFGQIDRVEF